MERFAGLNRRQIVAQVTQTGFTPPNAPNEVPEKTEVNRATVREMDDVSEVLDILEDGLRKGETVEFEKK